jgi:hypothetical protein
MDVKEITRNVISNYDGHSAKLLNLLKPFDGFFSCPRSLRDCIAFRKCYSCTVHFTLSSAKKPLKQLDNAWPIMIGSKLDHAFRKLELEKVYTLTTLPNLLDCPIITSEADIAITAFVVNGIAKQMPVFITNDATNIHVVKNKIVRVYRYNDDDKGMELNLYMDEDGERKQGEMMLRLSTGEEKNPTPNDLERFFDCGSLPIETKTLLQFMFRNSYDIDHLGNKVVFTPGHIFYRLFHKTLFNLIREGNWKEISKKHASVIKRSIENGDFSHIISKKTLFHKETHVANKMVSKRTEQLREMGTNNQVYVEKRTTCYRDVNFRCYQLIPYLSQTAFFQISAKVKVNNVLCFNDSHVGFLCVCGTAEARNVGRQMTLTRDVQISLDDRTGAVYEVLRPIPEVGSGRYLVVNGACIPVAKNYFDKIDLSRAKRVLKTVECYSVENYVFVNFKPGMIFKKFGDIWVTPKDLPYWVKILGPWSGFSFITSYVMDLIPYFNHNAFPKNVLAINALKNSIMSLKPDYSVWFRETSYEYNERTDLHRTVMEARNEFSKAWVIVLPQPMIALISCKGMTQEDCIVLRSDVQSFDSRKYHTLKLKLGCERRERFYFHEGKGDSLDPKRLFLGTLACLDSSFVATSLSIHVHVERVSDNAAQIYFNKSDFRLLAHEVLMDPEAKKNESFLYVTVAENHACSNGDKLCSLAGQKGVVIKSDRVPYAANVVPDLLVNPLSIVSRQTMGQIMEMKEKGGDYSPVYNSEGKLIPNAVMMAGRVFYFIVKYQSKDHLYVGVQCTKDKITGQPVRGRSRLGGMRAGTQEMINGFRGNGLSASYEEKILENSDSLFMKKEGAVVPRSAFLCEEDSKMFKVTMKIEIEPLVIDATFDCKKKICFRDENAEDTRKEEG